MNPRLFRIKEKALRYNFMIQHCPGKWQRGADAISRSPIAAKQAFIHAFNTAPSPSETSETENIEALVEYVMISDFKEANTINIHQK